MGAAVFKAVVPNLPLAVFLHSALSRGMPGLGDTEDLVGVWVAGELPGLEAGDVDSVVRRVGADHLVAVEGLAGRRVRPWLAGRRRWVALWLWLNR